MPVADGAVGPEKKRAGAVRSAPLRLYMSTQIHMLLGRIAMALLSTRVPALAAWNLASRFSHWSRLPHWQSWIEGMRDEPLNPRAEWPIQ